MNKQSSPQQHSSPQPTQLSQSDVMTLTALGEVKSAIESLRGDVCALRSEVNRKEDKLDSRIDKLGSKILGEACAIMLRPG